MAIKGFADNPQQAFTPALTDWIAIQQGELLENMKKITYEDLMQPLQEQIDSLDDDKADKDTDAVAGNFAYFDGEGNPVDSGQNASNPNFDTVKLDEQLIESATIPASTDDMLRIKNTQAGKPHTILELRSPDTATTEATLSLHNVPSGTDDWVFDLSFHNYSSLMKMVSAISHFTGENAGSWEWISRYSDGVDYSMIERMLMRLDGQTGYLLVGEDGSATARLHIKQSGYLDAPSVLAEIDSSHENQPEALQAKNNTNFAHVGNLARFRLLNATDTGVVLKLENAGTGDYINADDKFVVDNDGNVTAPNITELEARAENRANKKTTLADNSDTFYPTQKAVKTAVDLKADITTVTALTTRVDSLEREVQPIGVLFEGMPSVVTGERTLGAQTSTLRVNTGSMNTDPYPETDIRFQFPFSEIRTAKIDATGAVVAWIDEPDFLTASGIIMTRLSKTYVYTTSDQYDIRFSKTPRVGYAVDPLFWDEVNGVELEYVWIGSDKSSKMDGENKLTCELLKPYYTNVRMDTVLRPYSEAIGDGWSQADIALREHIRKLLLVAGNSHNSQTVFGRGVCDLRYSASDVVTVETVTANYVVVSDATGALYNVGEWVNLGTSLGNTSKFAQRKITFKEANYDGLGNTRITVDGATFTSSATNVLWHAPQLVSEEDFIAMGNECGYIGTNGRVPVSFFGIWNLWGNIWEWCDGFFHVDLVPYYTYDDSKYSLIGATQPADLGQFTQHATTMPVSSGYCGQFAGSPAVPSTLTGGSDSAGMCDYFYTSTGYKALRVGGLLIPGSADGCFDWNVGDAPSGASWSFGSRLKKRP